MNTTTYRANVGTIATLLELCSERTPWVTQSDAKAWAETASAEQVAAKIDWLEEQPVVKVHTPAIPDTRTLGRPTDTQRDGFGVPAGRYAVVGEDRVTRFYKVDRPTEGKWKGYVFVKIQASDDLHPLRGKAARDNALSQIAAAGVQASMELYGRELGHCGHCGRTLTDEDSRARGIGPICYGKMGF